MAQSSATVSYTRAKAYSCLTIGAGETVSVSVEINVNADGTNESLTGDDLLWSMRPVTGTLNVLNKSVGDGITVTSEANGTATIAITSANTKTLEPGLYFHQLYLEDSSENREVIFRGLIRLQPQFVLSPQTQVLQLV